jgi:DUF1680 family protein
MGRILASLGNYLYSTGGAAFWVHFYAQNSANVIVDGKPVQVRLTSTYPWGGAVRLALTLDAPQRFALKLRIPGWCDAWSVNVNGAPIETAAPAHGYIAIDRTWQSGDVVELHLAMPVQAVYVNPNVRQLQGRLALQRGPIVYCMEGVDNGAIGLERIALDPAQVAAFSVDYQPDLLGGVTVLCGPAEAITEEGWNSHTLYRRNRPSSVAPVDVVAIPYATWDNRAPGEMRVWFRTA